MDPVIRRDEISMVFDKSGTGCEGVGVGVRGLRRRAAAVGGLSGQSALLNNDKDGYLWVAQSGCLSQETLSPTRKIKHIRSRRSMDRRIMGNAYGVNSVVVILVLFSFEVL